MQAKKRLAFKRAQAKANQEAYYRKLSEDAAKHRDEKRKREFDDHVDLMDHPDVKYRMFDYDTHDQYFPLEDAFPINYSDSELIDDPNDEY